MVTDEEREWLASEMTTLIAACGIDSYVAAPLVEANDRWFPDDWHPDHNGVARLAKRVFEHAGLADVAIATELADEETSRAITPLEVEADHIKLLCDPVHLTDPLTIVSYLARLAAVVLRARHELENPDPDQEHQLVDLTTIYLGFGILTTNAAYRYRASGEVRGNTAITRWSHDEQGALSANMMAWALATQLVARNTEPSELRAVRRQLETNQAEVFDTACRTLKPDYVALALNLPSRSKWPPRREPPAAPTSKTPRLWKQPGPTLPTATVKSKNYLGFNQGRSVLRVPSHRRWEMGFLVLTVSLFATIPLMVKGFAGGAMAVMAAAFVLGAYVGTRMRREHCSDPNCGWKLKPSVEKCPRCGGHIAGTLLKGENRLEAEERLRINQDDYDLDVGEPARSGADLPVAEVHNTSTMI